MKKKFVDAEKLAKDSHKNCPVFLTLELLANKWAIRLLSTLMAAPKYTERFNALQRALSGISQRELSKQLKEFEAAGIVKRTVFAEIPPRVEYTMTALGLSLSEPIEALSTWAKKNGPKVQKNRLASPAKL